MSFGGTKTKKKQIRFYYVKLSEAETIIMQQINVNFIISRSKGDGWENRPMWRGEGCFNEIQKRVGGMGFIVQIKNKLRILSYTYIHVGKFSLRNLNTI